ncbi:MAG: matrixin family metalloprotease, partial [Bacteriovorax sp.]
MKKYFLFAVFLGWSQLVQAYILNQTKSGVPVHWPSSVTTVDIFVNSQNTQALPEATVQAIAESSIAQWNGQAKIGLRKNVTTGKDQANLNELYFSTDPNIFNGGGVIGVTLVGFKETNGEIVEADILINDNFIFSTSSNDQSYLGNVITHELGHFLGLGHGQVTGSTMFYALSRGQHKIDNDDKSGLYSLYPTGDATKGSLSGTIVGGKNLAPVFGAQVQAISVKNGKVMGAGISEINGKFRINGLSQNDQYLIYTNPIKQLGLPTNYANVKNNYCESGKKYRGSFFQSCGSSSEGFPEAVKLNTSEVNIGNITIRCGLDSPPEYFQKKNITPSDFDVNAYSNSGLGGSFVGFFSTAEMLSGSARDYFRLNLSQVNWDGVSTSPSLYLELKVLNQAFYSPFKANVLIKRASGSIAIDPKYNQESDGWL